MRRARRGHPRGTGVKVACQEVAGTSHKQVERSMRTELVDKIQSAYEADQVRKGRTVTRPPELPVAYEDLTPEWLTAALCKDIAGAYVESFQIEWSDNGTSNRCRLALAYNDVGRSAGLPIALFCKSSQGLANRILLGMSGGAFSEVTFYNKFRPHLEIEAPICYFAHLDAESFNSIVMLDDLSHRATEFCSHHTRMPRERAESQIRLLAALHGQSYCKPQVLSALKTIPNWTDYLLNTESYGLKEGANNGFLAAEAVIPARLYRRHEEVWPKTLESALRHRNLPLTLSHGDVHLKNWYITGRGEMGLSDWQCATHGHWGRDLAYTIGSSLSVEDRRAWERELIEMYLDLLAGEGGEATSFDEAWEHYRQQMISALAWWTGTLTPAPGLPDMQPKDTTLEFIHRISTAMDDLESLDI